MKMKFSKKPPLFLVALLIVIAISLYTTTNAHAVSLATKNEGDHKTNIKAVANPTVDDVSADHFTTVADDGLPLPLPSSPTNSLRGITRRFLSSSSSKISRMTCSVYPRICRAKGSGGPDCCRNKCVNVESDRYNCGRCGKKCKYSEICCRGQCVNPMVNRRHCGGCNNNCSKGSLCVYGMCGYA